MKLKFHTGAIIEVNDEHLLKLLKKDKRYTEVKNKKDGEDEKSKDAPKKDEEVKDVSKDSKEPKDTSKKDEE